MGVELRPPRQPGVRIELPLRSYVPRFHFSPASSASENIDRPGQSGAPLSSVKSDYGLVVRIFDLRTKQPVMIAAGLTTFATQATGEFLTDPSSIADLTKQLPAGWTHRNIEVLLRTDLIDSEPGPRLL